MKLKNKVALITGGGSGIGEATVLRFSKEGAKVVINDVNIENANSVAKKVKANGGEVLVCIADVCNPEFTKDVILSQWVNPLVKSYRRSQPQTTSCCICSIRIKCELFVDCIIHDVI